jgi:hypothetical protein
VTPGGGNMKEVVVHAPHSTMEHGRPGVAALITVDGEPFDIFYRVSQGPLASAGETFLCAALFPAMAVGAPLRIDAPIAPRFIARVNRIQEIFSTWYPELHMVPIEAQPLPAEALARPWVSRRAGCFFSGGVDSFYSVLKHMDEPMALITIYGFDIRLADHQRRAQVSRSVHEAGRELNKQIIEVETNVRDLLDIYTSWLQHSDGAALCGVALLLAPMLHTVYVAAGRHYSDLQPVGVSPLGLDLWATPDVDIANDGGEVTRYQKVARIAQSQTALRHLRVCWEQRNSSYNCGECPKCLHTMVDLTLLGALGRCSTFANVFDLDLLRKMPPLNVPERIYFEDALSVAEQSGAYPELTQALQEMLKTQSRPHTATAYPDGDSEQLHKARLSVARLQSQLNEMSTSSSWRLTAPLRYAARRMRRLTGGKG